MGGEECRSSRKTSVCLPKWSIFNAFSAFQGDMITSISTHRKGEMLPQDLGLLPGAMPVDFFAMFFVARFESSMHTS